MSVKILVIRVRLIVIRNRESGIFTL